MRNSDIGHLRDEMNRAFDEKQRAFEQMKRVGNERSRIKAEMDESWDAVQEARSDMNNAYENQQDDWDDYNSQRDALSQEIDSAKERADEAHENMKSCYERSQEAWDDRDGASAKAYSDEAKGYKEERDDWNQEAVRLIEIAKSIERPNSQFHRCKADYNEAMNDHKQLQSYYQGVKERHEEAKEDFQNALERFNRAREAFNEAKKAEADMWYDKRCDECGAIIRCHRDWDNPPKVCKDCKMRTESQKQYLARNQDYHAKKAMEEAMSQVGRYKWTEDDCKIGVKAGWNRDRGKPCTDIVIRVKGIRGQHYHVVVDEDGDFCISEWRNG